RETRIGTADTPGEVHFRLAALSADGGALAHDLTHGVYAQPALVPAFPWLGAAVPAPPVVTVVDAPGRSTFSAVAGDATHVRWWLIQVHARGGDWATVLRPATRAPLEARALGVADPDAIAVTAVSETGVASTPTVVAP